MKKSILLIPTIIIVISILFLSSACDLKENAIKTTDTEQFAVENSKESAKALESNEEGIYDSVPTENEEEFEKIYNPPEGGSPENIGKIIFCSEPEGTEESGDYYLYTINPDGSEMTKLAFFGNWMWEPAWSPEYSRIAYSANLGKSHNIFIMTADGSENKQLTFGEGKDSFPTWSPDGNLIAYISYIDGTPNLYVIDIYGNNQKQLTFVEGKDTVNWPSYSPVEDAIAYTYNSSEEGIGERIIVVKSDGTEIVELPAPANPRAHFGHPGWSRDGKIMYFISNQSGYGEIWKIDYYKLIHNLTASEEDKYDDLGLMQLTNLTSLGAAATYRPRVSPDGKKIVFCGDIPEKQPSGYNLITINIDGTDITNITDFTPSACLWPDW